VRGELSLDPSASTLEGIERVVPGSALTIHGAGATSSRRFWSFSPFSIPRELPFEDAEEEVREALGRALTGASPGHGAPATSPAGRLLLELLPRARPIELEPSPAENAANDLLRAASSMDHPVAFERLAEMAPMLLPDSGPRASDLGARELFGATPGAIRAWLSMLARLFGTGARGKVLARALSIGLPVDRALEDPILFSEIASAARSLGRRWSSALPERARAAVAPLLEDDAKETVADPFVERRFLEAQSHELQAAHAALARSGALAPFLDPAVIELVFSLPSRFCVANGRAMPLILGGMPLPAAARGPSDAPPSWAEPWIARAISALDLERRPTGRSELHRLAGLGAFLESLEQS
jgi:hypothetical protein